MAGAISQDFVDEGDARVASPRHHSRRHAASRTQDYIFSQLIPYIGNKRKLLPLIHEGLQCTGLKGGVFVDLFAGSTVVSRFAKTLGFRVIANDWEPYSHEIALGTVTCNREPAFAKLGGATRALDTLHQLPPLEDYISRHLCPKDDEHPNHDHERMFFTRRNGMRIDAMREQIARWELNGLIDERERAYLLSSFIYAASYVSNTSGVFKGFHRGWGGKTKTALHRILSDVYLRRPALFDNGLENISLRRDAHSLAGELPMLVGCKPDIVYIDPPYNQHPYGSNYHVLNTIALWDKPPLSPTISVDGRVRDKSAIRKDWRTLRRSPYNFANEALGSLKQLVASIDAHWILMSYSTDGNMPLIDVLNTLGSRGQLRVFPYRYKRYRVSTPRMSSKSHNVEFVALVDLKSKPTTCDVEQMANRIVSLERTPLG